MSAERKALEPAEWQVNGLGERRALYTADQIREAVERADTVTETWLAVHGDDPIRPTPCNAADHYRAALLHELGLS